MTLRSINMMLPETLSKDLNHKYKECQKLVDFLKHIGLKFDLNLNNILYPSPRDMQKIFEFALEYITNADNGTLDLGQNISEKNYSKIKLCKLLSSWTKESWIIPELRDQEDNRKRHLLVYNSEANGGLKKKIQGNTISDQGVYKILKIAKQKSKKKTEELFDSKGVTILTEEDYKLNSMTTYSNNNYIVNKLMSKSKSKYIHIFT